MISEGTLRIMVKQFGGDGMSVGKGVHKLLIDFVDNLSADLDDTRNAQWVDVDPPIERAWTIKHLAKLDETSRLRTVYYLKDLLCSIVKHACDITKHARRKVLQSGDMSLALEFLNDVY